MVIGGETQSFEWCWGNVFAFDAGDWGSFLSLDIDRQKFILIVIQIFMGFARIDTVISICSRYD
jgi:hypothetical protein